MTRDREFLHVVGVLLLAALLTNPPKASCQEPVAAPAMPAEHTWDGTRIEIRYQGRLIFRARLTEPTARPTDSSALSDLHTLVARDNGKVDQVFTWVSRKGPLQLVGEVLGTAEAFACESERREDAPLIVRHSVGLSHSLLNRAVYDRGNDWLLSADQPTSIMLRPLPAAPGSTRFEVTASGHEIILRFRPAYYRTFRGLSHFQPSTYRVREESIAGWVSWFAYFKEITEQKIRATADVLSETLLPYGLEYLQIDDGYQQSPVGVPDTWLVPNAKFPSGLEQLSAYIRQKGLKPGIWTNVSFHQKEFAESHPGLFVRDSSGHPAFGNWVGYPVDGSNPEAVDKLVRPVYRDLRRMGWQYFKVDALRHLRYEGYNTFADHFTRKGSDREEAYRGVVAAIREEVGENSLMLGCWGIRPELVGLIDACRIGDDGFGYGGLAQYNSFNNVVWRNDPDHIQLTPEEAYRSCMVTSLTGSLFMLTDTPQVYRGPLVEPARRCIPVPFTRPGQVYDVDPSRSGRLASVATEVSGAGPRPVDADQRAYCDLYLLEVNMPFEQWMVLGRLGGGRDSIHFSDLGLRQRTPYLAFEFWTKRLLGTFVDLLPLDTIDARFRCQAICLRERKDHPQLLSTSRHVSSGAVDLKDVAWRNGVLAGGSTLVRGDGYTLYLTEPEGYRLSRFTCPGCELVSNRMEGAVRAIQIRSHAGGAVQWTAEYAGPAAP